MPVVYRGIRPGNFKDAISIVAIGRFQEGRIEAEKLLVKCPSKYQGAEVEKAYASAPAPGKALLMYVWPGVVAIWGAPSSRAWPPPSRMSRVDRGRRDLLPLARTMLLRLRYVPSCVGLRDPDDAAAAAPVRRLLRQLLLGPGPAAPLPDLDLLGGPGGVVSPVVLLGHR